MSFTPLPGAGPPSSTPTPPRCNTWASRTRELNSVVLVKMFPQMTTLSHERDWAVSRATRGGCQEADRALARPSFRGDELFLHLAKLYLVAFTMCMVATFFVRFFKPQRDQCVWAKQTRLSKGIVSLPYLASRGTECPQNFV